MFLIRKLHKGLGTLFVCLCALIVPLSALVLTFVAVLPAAAEVVYFNDFEGTVGSDTD